MLSSLCARKRARRGRRHQAPDGGWRRKGTPLPHSRKLRLRRQPSRRRGMGSKGLPLVGLGAKPRVAATRTQNRRPRRGSPYKIGASRTPPGRRHHDHETHRSQVWRTKRGVEVRPQDRAAWADIAIDIVSDRKRGRLRFGRRECETPLRAGTYVSEGSPPGGCRVGGTGGRPKCRGSPPLGADGSAFTRVGWAGVQQLGQVAKSSAR